MKVTPVKSKYVTVEKEVEKTVKVVETEEYIELQLPISTAALLRNLLSFDLSIPDKIGRTLSRGCYAGETKELMNQVAYAIDNVRDSF